MDRNITVCATDLAVITGHNPYKTKDEIILKYWKRHFKSSYDDCLERMKSKKIKLKKDETDYDTIKRIIKDNNITIGSELANCLKSNNVGELNKHKETILKSVDSKLNLKSKEEFKKSFNSFANTNFGVKNENKGIQLYESTTNNKVLKDTKFYKTELFQIQNEYDKVDTWLICGKIDGIMLPENTVIEIKNRVKNLFYTLRDYEKIQCYCYMFLLESNNTELVEVLKQHNNNDINIIKIAFDEEFWESQIMLKLEEFIADFYIFLEDPKRQINLLKLNNIKSNY